LGAGFSVPAVRPRASVKKYNNDNGRAGRAGAEERTLAHAHARYGLGAICARGRVCGRAVARRWGAGRGAVRGFYSGAIYQITSDERYGAARVVFNITQ